MLRKPLIFSEIEKPLKMAEHFYSSTMFCFQAQDDINKKTHKICMPVETTTFIPLCLHLSGMPFLSVR